MIKENIFDNLIIFLIGPTCTNKTKLVKLLNKYLPIEIINVDSTHIYKYMNIGTNKPNLLDRKNIIYHLIDILDPSEYYSIFKFFSDVNNLIIKILHKNYIPVLVGGSMLYFNILLNGINYYPYNNNLNIRNSIYKKYYRLGKFSIFNVYKKYNIKYPNIHINDIKRIIRNLEIYYLYYFNNKNYTYIKKYLNFNNIKKIAIYPNDLNIIHKKIKFRFYKMLELGLEKEVEYLFRRKDLNLKLPSINCIGYKQMWYYFLNKINYQEMINKSIIATNKLLKHQLTWLKNWKKKFNDIFWLNDININNNLSIIMKYIIQKKIILI